MHVFSNSPVRSAKIELSLVVDTLTLLLKAFFAEHTPAVCHVQAHLVYMLKKLLEVM